MKKLLGVILVIVIALLGFTACVNDPNVNNNPGGNGGSIGGDGGGGDNGGAGGSNDDVGTANKPATTSRTLIVYFSCTNTTEAIAKHIEAVTKGALYKIVPEVPYTEADLKYYTNGRADREQADSNARPAINGSVENIEKYDVIFLGYPIWHGQAPRIISTFLESYDFAGKTIIPFCTSHSSGIGSSDTNLHALAPSAEWLSGRRFSAGTAQSTVADWIDSLNLNLTSNQSEHKETAKMYLTINGNKIEVTLEQNSSVDALVEILKQGDITYTASDYGGFEKVGGLGHTLPTSNSQLTTQAGDVILYSGNQIVLFYGSNSWSYTRLGRINGYTVSELKALLGAGKGDVQVTISLE